MTDIAETGPLAGRIALVTGASRGLGLTFARALGSVSRDHSLVLEYDQNDRIGWVLTQTGDRTFAIDFRVRHVF